jgi:hypothetical protein
MSKKRGRTNDNISTTSTLPNKKYKKTVSDKPQSASSKRREAKREEFKSGDKVIYIPYDERRKPQKWEEIQELDATKAFTLIYGFHPEVNLFKTDNLPVLQENTARGWWEKAGAIQQCNNVIGENEYGNLCYICGFPINQGQPAECEHVLPIFKASLYLHLYKHDYKSLFTNKTNTPILDSNGKKIEDDLLNIIKYELSLEYKWAHRCCNQVKSDTDFIKFTASSRKKEFTMDYDSTKRILREIANRLLSVGKENDICSDPLLKTDFENNLKKIKGNDKEKKEKWIIERADILNSAKTSRNDAGTVRAIVNYLNGIDLPNGIPKPLTANDNYNLFLLTSLSKVILAADMNDVWRIWSKGMGNDYHAITPMGEIISKAMSMMEISKFIGELLQFDFKRISNKDIQQFYKDILMIVDLRKTTITRDNTKTNYSDAVLVSLQYLNDLFPNYKNFFRNMFSLIYYNGLIETKNLAETKYRVANIANMSFSFVSLLIYINNVNNSPIFIENRNDATIVGFREKIITKINDKLNDIYNVFVGNEDDWNVYATSLLFLLSKIDANLTAIIYSFTDQFNSPRIHKINSDDKSANDFLENCVILYFTENAEEENIFTEFENEYANDDEITKNAKNITMGSIVLADLLNKNNEKIDGKDDKIAYVIEFINKEYSSNDYDIHYFIYTINKIVDFFINKKETPNSPDINNILAQNNLLLRDLENQTDNNNDKITEILDNTKYLLGELSNKEVEEIINIVIETINWKSHTKKDETRENNEIVNSADILLHMKNEKTPTRNYIANEITNERQIKRNYDERTGAGTKKQKRMKINKTIKK